jgi:hypothetical protein
MKLGVYIMDPEPISTAFFINPSHQSVCLSVYPPIVTRQRLYIKIHVVARQQLGINITTATNIQATVEELLDVSFSMQSMSYEGK